MKTAMRLFAAASLLLFAVACRPKGPVNLCPSFEVAEEVAGFEAC